MKRLTERTKYGIVGNNNGVENFPLYSLYDETHLDHGLIEHCFNKLAEYEDAEEQGLILRLPCKVGGTVWKISRFLIGSECGDLPDVWYRIDQDNFTLSMLGYYGKTIFLTKEEAEQALAKMKEV